MEIIGAGATVFLATRTSINSHDMTMFAVLTALGVIQAEFGRQTERMRRKLTASAHINMTSVWTFAGVLLLPLPLVAALTVVLYLQLSIRSWYRLGGVSAYRAVMNTTFVIITCYLARGVLELTGVTDIRTAIEHGWAGVAAITLAGALYFWVGAVIVIPILQLRTKSKWEVLGSWSDNVLECATLCLGAVIALVLDTLPGLALALLPPLVILHRGVLVKQLEVAATLDEKTGVLNTVGWHHTANRTLAKATGTLGASVGVLMIDLDRFKRINDEYGHLAGDHVLKSVAACIAGEVREYDSVGRFGGEEFVVLLPRATAAEVCKIAERIRYAITAMEVTTSHGDASAPITGLSVSIGVAMYPSGGATIDALVHAADTALYRAKHDGRNKVVTFPLAA